MPWLPDGDARCDSCPNVKVGHHDRHTAIQMIRAGGWHHMIGTTIGGVPFEAILCRPCVKEEKKKTRSKQTLEQDEFPLDWPRGEDVGRQGVSSR